MTIYLNGRRVTVQEFADARKRNESLQRRDTYRRAREEINAAITAETARRAADFNR